MAYDLATGDLTLAVLLWRRWACNSIWYVSFFLGIPYGMGVADGKIFAATGEHSANDPLYRGEDYTLLIQQLEKQYGRYKVGG